MWSDHQMQVAESVRPASKSLNIEFRNKATEAEARARSDHFLRCYPSPDRAADHNKSAPKMMGSFPLWKTGCNASSGFSRKEERREFPGECHVVVSW